MRNLLERHLESEVSPGDHHRVGGRQNLVEVLESLRPLQLRDQRNVRRPRRRSQPARLHEIGRGLHEAERHHVHAETHAEAQVFSVLRCNGGGRQRHAGDIDSLVLTELTPLQYTRFNLTAARRLDTQLDEPVGEEQSVARADASREALERGRNASRTAFEIAGRDRQPVAGLEDNRAAALQPPRADLRPTEILENRHLSPCSPRRGANAVEGAPEPLPRAVGEIQAADVGPFGDQRVEDGVVVARGANGRDDFGVSHNGPLAAGGRWVLVGRPTRR